MALIREKRRLKGLEKTVMQLLGALLALMLAVSETHTSKEKKGIKKERPHGNRDAPRIRKNTFGEYSFSHSYFISVSYKSQ